MKSPRQSSRAISLWVVACSFLTCAGWVLSALHQLNVAGYSAAFLAGAIFFVIAQKTNHIPCAPRFNPAKWCRRFRRGFALAFLILAALEFFGGLLYAPTNYDALAYRVPRMLHWLAAGNWHWVHTDFQRLNTRATGIEWISVPLMLFFKTDRLLFLINIISFSMLPGLVFSVFTRLGVRPRAAWHWMWIVPTGYGFLLQAGSIGNDLFGAVWGLAALDFALRAKRSRCIKDLWLCLLAGALLTGAKTSDFPLLLPIAFVLLPSLPLIKSHLAATAGVILVVVLASFFPVAVQNIKHCGDWSGQAAEQAEFMKGSPVLHVTQNLAMLAVQNFVPPIFPWAGAWNRAIMKVVPAGRMKRLEASFEPGGAHLILGEMQLEEDAGLGLGVCLLLVLTFAATFFGSKSGAGRGDQPPLDWFQISFFSATLISVLPYLCVSGSTTAARLLMPYYSFIIPLFLLRQTGSWIKHHAWWRWAAALVFLLAALVMVVSPPRPLWPANYILSRLGPARSTLMKRATIVYSVYSQRADSFAPAKEQLPPDARVIGLVTFDDPETSLWHPFGSRRVEHVTITDTAADLNQRGIKYVLINPDHLVSQGLTLDQWLARYDAKLIKMIPLTLRASRGALDWALVQIKPAGTKDL